MRGHPDQLLPRKTKVAPTQHRPGAEIASFIRDLQGKPVQSALALEFPILTGTKANDVMGARRREIDLGNKLWIVPGVGSTTFPTIHI